MRAWTKLVRLHARDNKQFYGKTGNVSRIATDTPGGKDSVRGRR